MNCFPYKETHFFDFIPFPSCIAQLCNLVAHPVGYICPKVRIADLIELTLDRSSPDFWKHLAPINQKHVDFILVNRSDFAPRVAIELDGGSHKDQERAKRDRIIDSVFHNAGILILHIPVKGFYSSAEITHLIEQTITATRNTPATTCTQSKPNVLVS